MPTSIDDYDQSATTICCGIRSFTTLLRFPMFKWNKFKLSSGEPTTPKMVLASLPDTDSWAGSPPPKVSPTSGKPLKSFLGRLTPDRRAETPHPAPKLSHRSEGAYVPRLRTVSMSKQEDGTVPFRYHERALLNLFITRCRAFQAPQSVSTKRSGAYQGRNSRL